MGSACRVEVIAVSRRIWAPLVAGVLLLALAAGYLAWNALQERDAQIASLRDELQQRQAEIVTLRGDLERRTSELRSARDDVTSTRADLTLRQQQLEAALTSAQAAQSRAATAEGHIVELEGHIGELESQLDQANDEIERLQGTNTVNPLPSEAPPPAAAGPDLAPILAIDDALLAEGTTYINLTAEAETAIRANDYNALGIAFGKLQESRARWDALVKQRNDAIAALQEG